MQNRKQITLDGEYILIANVGEVTTASLASAPPVRCHHCWSVIAKNRWMRCFIRSEPEKKKRQAVSWRLDAIPLTHTEVIKVLENAS